MTVCDEGEHVFILGSARSGTSLLASIIQNSPRLASYHAETKLLRECEHKYGNLANLKSRTAFLKDWLNSRQFTRSGLSQDDAMALLKNNRSYICFLSAYMNLVAQRQACDRWIDSTPDNLYALDSIIPAFPNARVIHMVRDGRAVALSLAKLEWSGVRTNNFDKALLYSALKWQDAVCRTRKSAAFLNDRYLEVRYEDFVSEPESEIEEICAFLHIPNIDDISMKEDAGNNQYSTLHTPNTPFSDLSKGISTTAISRWKNALSEPQKKSLEAYIGDTLKSFGYELISDVRLSLGDRALRKMRRNYLNSKHVLKRKTILSRFLLSPLEIGLD